MLRMQTRSAAGRKLCPTDGYLKRIRAATIFQRRHCHYRDRYWNVFTSYISKLSLRKTAPALDRGRKRRHRLLVGSRWVKLAPRSLVPLPHKECSMPYPGGFHATYLPLLRYGQMSGDVGIWTAGPWHRRRLAGACRPLECSPHGLGTYLGHSRCGSDRSKTRTCSFYPALTALKMGRHELNIVST